MLIKGRRLRSLPAGHGNLQSCWGGVLTDVISCERGILYVTFANCRSQKNAQCQDGKLMRLSMSPSGILVPLVDWQG